MSRGYNLAWVCRYFFQEFLRTYPLFRKTVQVPSNLAVADIVAYLTKHAGITDLTGELTKWQAPDYPIAAGGQGQVYCASRSDGALFAIKCINSHTDEKYGKHTAQELSTWAKLKNPKILELSGLGMFRGRLAMISPWMEGGSVKNVLKANPSMDAYAVCEQLAEVVRFLHDLNVVHGDIKGDNLLMGPDGNIKLTDFGLSVMHDKTLQFSSTELGGGGTLRWMEKLYLDGAERTKEADIYAVGMSKELITGKIPFAEITNSVPVIKVVLHEKRTPDISDLAKEPISPRAYIMIGAMHRCWRYDPKERIEAKELVKLLDVMGKV
ncbi:cytoplasmic tyrosine-protein kinase BMX [Ceratobasidium sp. AG-Ba]|nr:cytoplasmic tyrosine-protein kinase BMX [Ceratobasidium sp. AG-Ba]